MEDGIEGFIPLSQLGIEGLRKPADSFKPADELDLKVTRVDAQAHRIILSARAWLADQDRGTQEAFAEQYKPNPSAEETPSESSSETPSEIPSDALAADVGEDIASS